MITLDMVKFGYDSGLINLILSPNGDGIACSIGDNWFYFGGHIAEEYNNVESYKRDISAEDIINEIYEVLEDFSDDIGFEDEYLYYEYYLREKIRDPNITRNPEGKAKLQIVSSFASEDFGSIYSVSLAHGFFVDVKAFEKTGLIYIMENHDGSTVYGIAGPDVPIPNYNYDEASVIKFVKDFHEKEMEQHKVPLSDRDYKFQDTSTYSLRFPSKKTDDPQMHRSIDDIIAHAAIRTGHSGSFGHSEPTPGPTNLGGRL